MSTNVSLMFSTHSAEPKALESAVCSLREPYRASFLSEKIQSKNLDSKDFKPLFYSVLGFFGVFLDFRKEHGNCRKTCRLQCG